MVWETPFLPPVRGSGLIFLHFRGFNGILFLKIQKKFRRNQVGERHVKNCPTHVRIKFIFPVLSDNTLYLILNNLHQRQENHCSIMHIPLFVSRSQVPPKYSVFPQDFSPVSYCIQFY